MQKFFLMSSLITVMSLGSVITAQAEPLAGQSTNNSTAPYLIASPFRTEVSPAHQRRHRLMKMLVLQMEMNELAQEAMSSEDPEVRALAEEIMTSSSQMTDKVLELIQKSPRSGQFSR